METDNATPARLHEQTQAALLRCCEQRIASRIIERDPALWPGDAHRWLDWLDAPQPAGQTLAQLDAMAAAARAYDDVLLLGMGGSSLCPEVLAESFGRQPGFPRLRILDSSIPGDVLQRAESTDPARTLLIVASKSGSTLETDVARRYFTPRAPVAKDGRLPIVAITDPGSSLAQLAEEQRYRHVALGRPGIGGRFSALSVFGLLPAATMGIDVARLLAPARAMAARCARDDADNPGLELGVAMATAARAGRDKLTLLCSPAVATLGAWVEQLVAESTGKDGKGIIPIDLEAPIDPPTGPRGYGDDRLFVYTRLGEDDTHAAAVEALRAAGHPVHTLHMSDLHDLGAEFFRWQFATAVAGHLMELNPFDQPDVEAAKKAARRRMEAPQGAAESLQSLGHIDNLELWAPAGVSAASPQDALRAALSAVPDGGYVAIQAYVPRNEATTDSLSALRARVRDCSGRATTYGFGPRFLHSTGQLHKGGPAGVLCIQITVDDPQAVPIPERDFDFGALARAQADGDFEVLAERGRAILRLHAPASDAPSLSALVASIDGILA